jgi:hypothetical protein
MSLYNQDKKKRRAPGTFLKDRDMALIICLFTVIFGILHAEYTYQPITLSPLYLILGLIYTGFWLGMAFSAGRRVAKGFIIPASVIWGISLLYLIINYLTYKGLKLDAGNALNTVISFIGLIMLFMVIGTVFPLLPGIAALGFFPKSISADKTPLFLETLALQLVLICAAFIIFIASAFFIGLFYERKKSLLPVQKPSEFSEPDFKE